MMNEPHIIDTDSLEWAEHTQFPGIRVKTLESRATHPAASLILVQVDVGRIITTHVHPIETETAFVMAGKGILTVGDDEYPVSTGTSITISPGLPHSLHNTGDSPLELIAMHTPPTR